MGHGDLGPHVAWQLRRVWPLLLILALFGGGAAVAAGSLGDPPSARAEARVVVAPTPGAEEGVDSDTIRILTQGGIIATFVELLGGPDTTTRAADRAGLGPDDEPAVTAYEVQGSLVVEVVATTSGASEDAVELAREAITDGADLFAQLYPAYRVEVLDDVRPAPEDGTALPELAAVGALAGLAAGIGVLVVWPASRRRRRAAMTASAPPPPPGHRTLEPDPMLVRSWSTVGRRR